MNIIHRQKDALIQAIANDSLPKELSLYVVDDRALFGMRGASGGLVTSHIFYITDIPQGYQWNPKERDRPTFYRRGISVPVGAPLSYKFWRRLFDMELATFQSEIKTRKAKEAEFDGGDLGSGDNEGFTKESMSIEDVIDK